MFPPLGVKSREQSACWGLGMNISDWIVVVQIVLSVATVYLAFATRRLAKESAGQVEIATSALKAQESALKAQERPLVVINVSSRLKRYRMNLIPEDIKSVGGLPGLFCEGPDPSYPSPSTSHLAQPTFYLYSVLADFVNLGTGPARNLSLYLVYNDQDGQKTYSLVPEVRPTQIIGARNPHDTNPYMNAFAAKYPLLLLGYALEYQSQAKDQYWTQACAKQGDPLLRMERIEFGEGRLPNARYDGNAIQPSRADSRVLEWAEANEQR